MPKRNENIRLEDCEEISTGQVVAVQLLNGEKLFGTLEKMEPNIYFIKDWNDTSTKDVHDSMIQRMLVFLRGGNYGSRDEGQGCSTGFATDKQSGGTRPGPGSD